MLTDTQLRNLKPRDKAFKVSDRDGLYVAVSPSGTKAFRYDYRVDGKRETLTVGRYDESLSSKGARAEDELAFGISLSLVEARQLLNRARRQVEAGVSPSKAKVEKRTAESDAETFGAWVLKYFEHKADPKSGKEQLADSTLALRKSVYRRILEEPLGKKRLDEIKPTALAELLDKAKAERGPGPAVHARELVLLVYRYAIGKGVEVDNPADKIARKAIATFQPRDRNLSRQEVKAFFDALQHTATAPTLRLAVKFMLLTGVRKGEFIGATWKEVDWDRATWTIPKERMKADREHVVYLSEQALDILTTFQTCFPSSKFLHPGRYESDLPISNATLNRTIDATVKLINDRRDPDAEEFETFSVHDLRRTFSTRLNDALFPEALIEACLAHAKKDQVAAAYNHAKHAAPRRALMQGWADMVDCWIKGESAKAVIQATKIKIDEAAHDDSESDL
ncbi:MAG: tyrosine-type recombinase/integrase [Acidovorax sp.]|uniref:tyrosine-type recombinase/integrase n=1 Tax=Acidovorax sp. TaxID=1872122 RepID=UPI002639896D|nr:site-specific integrase [Acidovorax sp.]MDH4466148.1 tyrosine-type recombinase/integrase [Acidovorax sp.]